MSDQGLSSLTPINPKVRPMSGRDPTLWLQIILMSLPPSPLRFAPHGSVGRMGIEVTDPQWLALLEGR